MRRRTRQSGFTMVEVLVSLILSAIAMIGIIALYRAQTVASSFSRRNTEATILAEDLLERLRTQTKGVLSSGSAGDPFPAGKIDETGKATATGVFTRTFTATPSAGSGYDDIVVSVAWTEDGLPKTVTLRGRRNN